MYIKHLRLTNFRNYADLEIDLPQKTVIIHGDNAQGKSNFLESIYLLATTRSFRSASESELINWSVLTEKIPVCRIEGDVRKAEDSVKIEVAIRGKTQNLQEHDKTEHGRRSLSAGRSVQKRIRVNNIVRRAIDLIGEVNIVSFNVHDINIIGGEPSLRRRYLDISNSQVDREYLRNLRRYQRVIWQRNRLLREIAAGNAGREELNFWTDELVGTGTFLICRRIDMLRELEKHTCTIYSELTGEEIPLKLIYHGSVDADYRENNCSNEEISRAFSSQLYNSIDREIIQGLTLAGPHRDELRFVSGDVDLGVYGSRGQQRLAALALKLAEARFMIDRTDEHPILLLDDVMSELDNRRRNHLLKSVSGYQQVIMTSTDLEDYSKECLESSMVVRISNGTVL